MSQAAELNFKSVGIRRKPRKKQLFNDDRGNVNLSRHLKGDDGGGGGEK